MPSTSLLNAVVAAVFLAATGQVAAQAVITTPASLTQCEPAAVSWSGATGTVYISVHKGVGVTADKLENFPNQNGANGTYTWTVDVSAGDTVSFHINDGSGSPNYSAGVVVGAGSSDCKLIDEGSGTTGGSTTGNSSTGTASPTTSSNSNGTTSSGTLSNSTSTTSNSSIATTSSPVSSTDSNGTASSTDSTGSSSSSSSTPANTSSSTTSKDGALSPYQLGTTQLVIGAAAAVLGAMTVLF